MLDPDQPIPLIAVCFIVSFFLCAFLSASLRAEPERQRRAKTGFSAEMLGALLFIAFSGGCFCYYTVYYPNSAPAAFVWGAFYIAFGVLLPFTLGQLFSPLFSRVLLPLLNPLTALMGNTLGWALSLPSQLAARIFGGQAEPVFTEEEILSAVDSAEEQDFIDETQKEMIANIFELDEITAGDAMTHRTDMIAMEENAPIIDAIRLSMQEGVSRIPVYRKNLDEIIGIVFVKDLFFLLDDDESKSKPAAEFARSVMYTPETARARALLTEFKKKHTQIAIVVDEYGGTSGLVTMEDILEEIVGDMQDEFDDEEELVFKIDEATFLCDAAVDAEDIFKLFSLPIPEEYEEEVFETIGGLVIDKLGRIPGPDELPQVAYAGINFTVKEMAERRILKVLCEKQKQEEAPEDGTL